MEPIFSNEAIVGHVSSGGFGHRTQKSLALAYINLDALSDALSVKILGNMYSVTVTKGSVYDSKNERIRAND